jgi:hypothetical protein
MDIVVNSFTLKDDVNWSTLKSDVNRLQKRLAEERSDFNGVSLVRIDDTHAMLVVLFKNRRALEDISNNIAAPWFAEHVRPNLVGQVSRQVGEIVAGK